MFLWLWDEWRVVCWFKTWSTMSVLQSIACNLGQLWAKCATRLPVCFWLRHCVNHPENLTRSFKTNKRTSQVCFCSDACFFLDIHKHLIIYQAYFGLLVIKVLETSSLALSDLKSNSFKSFTKSDLAWWSKKLLPTSFFISLGNYIDRLGKAALLYPYTVSLLCLTPEMYSMLTQFVSGMLFLKIQLKKISPQPEFESVSYWIGARGAGFLGMKSELAAK